MLPQSEVIDRLEISENLHFLHVKDSTIQGVGLFSGVNLAAGTILFEIKGERVVHPEYDPYLADKNPNWMGIGYCEWIIMYPNNNGLFINHSCNPNVIINDKLQLVTFKPVKADEELLLDYSTTELDPNWRMQCNCGEYKCRRTLRSFQFLPKFTQRKYSRFIAPVFTDMAYTPHLQKPTHL
jgi:SET domain-containing protein